MKTYPGLVLMFLLWINAVNSQTPVGGSYWTDQHWKFSGSPYTLTDNVIIPTGVNLTIDPGVTVEFTDQYVISLKGSIQAVGKPDSVVLFDNAGGGPESKMLRILNADLSLSQIKYLDATGNGIVVFLEGDCLNTLNIENVSFNEGNTLCIDATTAAMVVKYGDFSDSEIQIKYSSFYSSVSLKLENTIFHNCYIENRADIAGIVEMEIKDSEIIDCTIRNGGFYDSDLIITNSVLDGCLIGGYYSTTTVRNSKMVNCTFSNSFMTQQCQVYLNFENCIFTNSNIEAPYEWWTELTASNTIINIEEGNLFSPNRIYVDQCNITGTGTGIGLITTSQIIENTTIKNFDIGISIREDDKLFTINRDDRIIVNCNIWQNSTYNVENKLSSDWIADHNYWGVTTREEIEELIYDYYDNIDYGEIIITEWLYEPDTNCPISAPVNEPALYTDDGVLLTWTRNPEPDVAGYNVYFGEFDGLVFDTVINNSSDTSCFLPYSLISDVVGITAYDNLANDTNDMVEGHESWYSFFDDLLSTPEPQITSEEIKIWPMPAVEYFNIEAGSANKILDIIIIDLLGRNMHSQIIENRGRIDCRKLLPGVYILIVKDGAKFSSTKILITN